MTFRSIIKEINHYVSTKVEDWSILLLKRLEHSVSAVLGNVVFLESELKHGFLLWYDTSSQVRLSLKDLLQIGVLGKLCVTYLSEQHSMIWKRLHVESRHLRRSRLHAGNKNTVQSLPETVIQKTSEEKLQFKLSLFSCFPWNVFHVG